MSSQKLVRCEVNHLGVPGASQLRYVPLEIFGLWEFLMTQRHQFEIGNPRASLWLDAEETPESQYEDEQVDRVTEVSVFLYSGRDEMFVKVCRYFPTADCEGLKKIFLSHYPSDQAGIQTRLKERQGFWVHRRTEPSSSPESLRPKTLP